MKEKNSREELIDTKVENLEVNEEVLEENKEKLKETKEERKARIKVGVKNLVKETNNKFLKIIEIYNYLNKHGKEYLRVLRNEGTPKFIIQHYEKGEWVKGLGDYPKVPYNLPNLIKAKENNKSVVFIVSGEKDADTINNADSRFLATTAITNSASKWDYNFNEYISKDTKVIILQDDSEFGQKFAEKTKQTLIYGHKSCIFEIKELKKFLGIEDSAVTDITDIKGRISKEEFIDILESLEESALGK